MYKGHSILCIIPARGGSKGLLGKNIKNLSGKPLIAYTIEQAKSSKYIDRIIVSTDDNRIAAVSRRYGAEVPFIRPKKLAKDRSGIIDVLLHAIKWMEEKERYHFDTVMLLHVTAPLRTTFDIDSCIELLFRKGAEGIFSVTEAHRNPYFNMVELKSGRVGLVKKGNFLTRQRAPKVYDMNASIYVWKKEALKEKKRVISGKSCIYIMPRNRSVDIDDKLDFDIVKMLLKKTKEL